MIYQHRKRHLKNNNRMRVEIDVETVAQTFQFIGFVYRAETQDELQLDLEFYQAHGNPPPPSEGTHFEIEILGPEQAIKERSKLHIHARGNDNAPFMCWPNHVPHLEKLVEVFKTWCILTACKLNTGSDQPANELFNKCSREHGQFHQRARSELSIFLKEEYITK